MWTVGEQRLARMAARGEWRAFEALFARYHHELYRYCRAILGEPDEAHDALQNTMAVALGHLPNLELRTSLRGWLYRIAHNEAVSMLRRRVVPLDPVRLPEGTAPGADVRVAERERVRQLVADLRELPGRQRGALVMRELSDLSYSQIAAAMETSEAGARQLVYEARESLRSMELGRDLECEAARRAISSRDGRVFRGRRLRAHLRACPSCRDFQAAIDTRRADLAVLFPPLAPAAASSLLASLLGGLGEGGASGAGAGAGAALGGMGVKAASIASVVALGAGAVGISGGIKSPFRTGDHQAAGTPAASAATPVPGTPRPGANATERATASPATRPAAHSEQAHRDARDRPPDRGYSTTGASRPTPPGAAVAAGTSGTPGGVQSPGSARSTETPGEPPSTSQQGGQPASPPASSTANGPVQAGSQSSDTRSSAPPDRGVALRGPELAPDKPVPSPSTQRISANAKP